MYVDGHDYFIMVVTYERNPVLVENIDLLRESFADVKTKFKFDIDAIVVFSDHFHMILKVDDPQEYSKIIGSVKRYFSKHCDPKYYAHLLQSQSRTRQHYKPVWQKRFYEHTIRNEKEYKTRLDYIHFNAVKHGYVEVVKDWKYSSFRKFVKNGTYDAYWSDFDTNINFE